MRKTFLAAAASLLGAGFAVGVPLAYAQVTGAPPPPPGMDGGPGMHRPMDGGPGMHRPMDGMQHGHWGGGMFHRMRQFALIFPARDRALSGADVQKVAEAFLLFNGNHTWKVTQVAEQPDAVTFALASPDGAPIAHFSMDRHTARVQRVD